MRVFRVLYEKNDGYGGYVETEEVYVAQTPDDVLRYIERLHPRSRVRSLTTLHFAVTVVST